MIHYLRQQHRLFQLPVMLVHLVGQQWHSVQDSFEQRVQVQIQQLLLKKNHQYEFPLPDRQH